MGKMRKNGISPSTLIIGIALVVAVASIGFTWYVALTRPKIVPKPHLVITAETTTRLPQRTAILVQNIGEAVAHDLLVFVRYRNGAKITFLDKGVFDLVEGGVGKVFARLEKDRVGRGGSLPYILLAGEKNGTFVEPEIYAESKETQKIPIHFMRESEET